MTRRIAVVGGGTSGLSAAYSLQKRKSAGFPLEFVVYEAGQQFGGVIRTERVDGCVIEAGPDSFLTEKPWAADLCRELGLGDELISSNDAERRTYMLINGRLLDSRRANVHGAHQTRADLSLPDVLGKNEGANRSRMALTAEAKAQGNDGG